MVEAPRFVDGKLHRFLRPWREAYFARHELISTANNALDGLPRLFEIDAQASEHVAGHAFPLTKQAKQKMLGADVVMVEVLRLFLGELHDFARPFGETIEVSYLVPACFGSLPTGVGPAVTCRPL